MCKWLLKFCNVILSVATYVEHNDTALLVTEESVSILAASRS